MSLEEIETMLNLGEDIKKTAFYQSILKSTKLEVVPMLLNKGLSIQEIAESLKVDVEEVRKIAEEQ
jgi:predicted transposase YdaD